MSCPLRSRRRPGLLLRDPFGYTETVLVLPHPWLALLSCLDGEHTELDAQALLTRLMGGELVPRERVRELLELLSEEGFLETDELHALEGAKARSVSPWRRFAKPPTWVRPIPIPPRGSRNALRPRCRLGEDVAPSRALAAPHVSPEGGFGSYRSAYAFDADGNEPTFVILGTSHYGRPDRFGLTRKPFRTPLGVAEVDVELHDTPRLAGRRRRRRGGLLPCARACRRVPGALSPVPHEEADSNSPGSLRPFAESLTTGKAPETRDATKRFFDVLGEIAASRSDLVWVLGVDMAHIGQRYGHDEAVKADEGVMLEVARARPARGSTASAPATPRDSSSSCTPTPTRSTGAGIRRSTRS